MEIIEELIAMGMTPPTDVSQTTDSGAKHNEAFPETYRHRIRRPI